MGKRSGMRLGLPNGAHRGLSALGCLILVLAGCAGSPAARLGANRGANRGAGEIPPTVLDFVEENGWDLAVYEASDLSDLSRFFPHERLYEVEAGISELWDAYRRISPAEAWTTSMTSFGLAWDPALARLVEPPGSVLTAFSVGQVFVLELRVAGFVTLPVAFRLSAIDDDRLQIEFVYLRRNKSNGLQRLRFYAAPSQDGRPRSFIEHRSWYASGNAFRDRYMYAPFHSDIVDAFHRNVLKRAGFRLIKVGALGRPL